MSPPRSVDPGSNAHGTSESRRGVAPLECQASDAVFRDAHHHIGVAVADAQPRVGLVIANARDRRLDDGRVERQLGGGPRAAEAERARGAPPEIEPDERRHDRQWQVVPSDMHVVGGGCGMPPQPQRAFRRHQVQSILDGNATVTKHDARWLVERPRNRSRVEAQALDVEMRHRTRHGAGRAHLVDTALGLGRVERETDRGRTLAGKVVARRQVQGLDRAAAGDERRDRPLEHCVRGSEIVGGEIDTGHGHTPVESRGCRFTEREAGPLYANRSTEIVRSSPDRRLDLQRAAEIGDPREPTEAVARDGDLECSRRRSFRPPPKWNGTGNVQVSGIGVETQPLDREAPRNGGKRNRAIGDPHAPDYARRDFAFDADVVLRGADTMPGRADGRADRSGQRRAIEQPAEIDRVGGGHDLVSHGLSIEGRFEAGRTHGGRDPSQLRQPSRRQFEFGTRFVEDDVADRRAIERDARRTADLRRRGSGSRESKRPTEIGRPRTEPGGGEVDGTEAPLHSIGRSPKVHLATQRPVTGTGRQLGVQAYPLGWPPEVQPPRRVHLRQCGRRCRAQQRTQVGGSEPANVYGSIVVWVRAGRHPRVPIQCGATGPHPSSRHYRAIGRQPRAPGDFLDRKVPPNQFERQAADIDGCASVHVHHGGIRDKTARPHSDLLRREP